MIGAVTPTPATSAEPVAERQDRLAEAARQLEGVFMEYLTQALRSTVPNEGNADAPGADIYGSMLDQHLAQVLANHTKTGIADALYRQLVPGAIDAPDQGKDF